MRTQTGVKLALLSVLLVMVSGPALGAQELVFPRFSFDPGTLTGLALANLGPNGVDVTLTAHGAAGEVLAGPGFQNPAVIRLESGQRIALLIHEIFGASLPPQNIGWVRVTAPGDGVTGFFLFLNGSLTQFDGADLPTPSREIVFNLVRHGSGYSTELNLVNPGETAVTVTATLVRPQLPELQVQLNLPGRAVLRQDAANLFQLAEIPRGSYARALASSGAIAGFQFVRTAGDLLGLNAKPSTERLTQLLFPQLVFGEPWSSELGVVNYTDQPTIITIYARNPDGTLFGSEILSENPVTRGLGPREALTVELAELLGFRGGQGYDGWLEVHSETAAINGYVSYGIPALGSLAGIASAPAPQRYFVFSHVATSGGFFTGLAMLNPGSLSVNTRVLALDNDGNRIGISDSPIRPGQRISSLITELIPGSEDQSGGMLWVSADLPIYASSLFGSQRVLANVPPQTAPPTYRPDAGEPRVNVTPSLAVVQPGNTQKFTATGVQGAVQWTVDGVVGGTPQRGLIDAQGNYTAPAAPPDPSYLAIAAEVAGRRGGASVDVLTKQTLLSGFGVLQSIVYLQSVQRLFEVELLSAAFSDGGSAPAAAPQQQNQSELFQVAPPAIKTSVNTFQENVVKLTAYSAVAGTEYVLLLGKDAGNITRLDPITRATRIVYTGLQQPTTMALDTLTGNLLVAEATRIVTVNRAFLEAGLPGSASLGDRVPDPSLQTDLVEVLGATGLGVDPCTGEVYFTQAATGTLYAFNRSTDEIREIVSGLSEPGQLLVLFRRGFRCPDAVQILIAEPGSDRIALVDPIRGIVVSWLPAPGVRDLTFLPPGNPFTGRAGIAFGVFFGEQGEIGIVDVEDQYEEPPDIEDPLGPCVDPVFFADSALEAAVREALGLTEDEALTCEAVAGLAELTASGRRIFSLVGLQHARSLRFLDISRNRIISLSPITDLTELEVVNASFNLITELGVLGNLLNLQELNLSHNLISDLSGLGNPEVVPSAGGGFRSNHLPALLKLDLSFNNLGPLGPLSGLTALRFLDLQRNSSLADLGPLAGLVNLEELSAGYNLISDLSPLRLLHQLAVLLLPYNRITSILPLLENPGIGEGDIVDLRGNPLGLDACDGLLELIARGIQLDLELPCRADLAVQLETNAVLAVTGQILPYRAIVSNPGPVAASQVLLVNQLPAGTVFVSATTDSGQCSVSGPSVTCTRNTLNPGESWIVDIEARVQVSTGNLVFSSSVSSAGVDDNPVDNTDSIEVSVSQADLSVTKSASTSMIVTGRPVTYTIEASNLGPQTATDILIRDSLPPGMGFSFQTLAGGTCHRVGLLVECTLPELAAGQSATLLITATVNATSGSLSNSVVVSAAQFDPNLDNNFASVSTELAEADLSITKTDSADPVSPGDPLSYVLTVTNNGPNVASGVTVTDSLPSGVTFVSASSAGCAHAAATVTCLLGTLAVDASQQVTINTTVTALSGVLTNTATVRSAAIDLVTSNNTATADTTVRSADLAVTKSESADPVGPGSSLTYTITVTNNGPEPALDVTVADPLPPSLAFVSVAPQSCSLVFVNDLPVVTCQFASIASGESVVITLDTTVLSSTGTVENTVTVASSVVDPIPGNNSATETTTIVSADLSITKTDSADPVTTGDALTYTLTVSNLGPDPATEVVVSDQLPAGLGFVSVTPAECGFIDGVVTCSFASLPVGDSVIVTVNTTVTATTGELVNSAVVASAVTDLDSSNNTAVESTTVVSADLAIFKSDSADPVSPGDELVYYLLVNNLGPDDATNVVITDAVPAVMAVQSVDAPGANCSVVANTVTCTLPVLNTDSEYQLSILTLVGGIADTVSNTATISSDLFDPDLTNNSATETTDPQRADIALAWIEEVDPVTTGDFHYYTLNVSNLGPDVATNIAVSYPVPAGLEISSVEPYFYCEGDVDLENVSCLIPSLEAQSSLGVSISAYVAATSGVLVHTATASADQVDPDLTNNTATEETTIAEADLQISKIADISPVSCSDNPTYTITVTNNGPHTSTGFTFQDQLLSTDQYITDFTASPGLGCNQDQFGYSITCTLDGSLAPGDSVELVVFTQFSCEPEGISLDNTATILSTSQTDPDLTNNSVTFQNPLAFADLELILTDDPDPVQIAPGVGGTVFMTAIVTNLGPEEATGISFFFSPPTAFSVIGASTEGGLCNFQASFASCDLNPLPSGLFHEVLVALSVPSTTPPGPYVSSAFAYSQQFDPDSSNDNVQEATTVEFIP